jgi:GNAT superfamily N-acetyltransferase
MSAKLNDIVFSIIDEEDISPNLDKSVRDILVECFPADREYYQQQSWWHCVPGFRVIGRNVENLIVAHTAMVDRSVIAGPDRTKVRVAGVQSFCVLPEYRGTCLSDKMMSIAMEEANKRHFDAGLLFCVTGLEKVYQRMGWYKLDATVYMDDDKEGKALIPAKNTTMFYPLRVRKFPSGDIDVAGTDW